MADLLDVLDYDESKRAINLNAARVSDQELVLEQAVTGISRLLDDLVGPIVVRTVANEIHDGYCWEIVPRKQPVYSITTVTEYTSTTPQTLIPEDFPTATTAYDYSLDTNGILHRRSSGGYSYFAGRVILTYQAGRYATTAAVDAQYKKTAAEILAGNWPKIAAVWSRGGDVFADPVFYDEVKQTVERWLKKKIELPVIG